MRQSSTATVSMGPDQIPANYNKDDQIIEVVVVVVRCMMVDVGVDKEEADDVAKQGLCGNEAA